MRLRVDIDFEQAVEDVEATTNAESNNVSNSPTYEADGYKGFQLSASVSTPVTPLDGTRKFFPESGYSGWMSKQISDANGNFATPIQWTINFSEVSKFLIVTFDRSLGEYASELEIRSIDTGEVQYVTNDDYRLMLSFEETLSVLLIIKKWNKAYKTAKIVDFDVGGLLSFEGSAIESVECSEQAWNSSFKIATGVMQQYADIVFRDTGGLLQGLSDVGLLTKFMPLSIYVQRRGEWKFLGTYISDVWSVDRVEDRVSVSCNDYTRNIPNYTVDVIGTDISVKRFLEILEDQMPEIEMVAKPDEEIRDVLNGEVITMENYLESCICKDVYFQSVDADTVLTELCDRWLLRIYWQADLQKYVVMEAW